MASRTFVNNNDDPSNYDEEKTSGMEQDDATEAAGSNREKNEEEEHEINVKWQLPGEQDATTAKKVVQELIAMLLINHPNDVTVIDSKKREWSFSNDNDEGKFAEECNQLAVSMHPIKNKQQKVLRWVTITQIRSLSNIKEWKNNDFFYSAVSEAGAYLFPHPFPVDAWDTITIGFIKNIHVVHYPRELLHEQIYHMITQQNPNPPPFQLIPQRIVSPNKQATTKAYTIQCQKDDASALIHLLTHGPFRTEPNQIFVPFRYKSKNPDLFLKCIRQQNETYHKTWIIKVEGFTDDMMKAALPEINKINGIMHVVPSKRSHDIGEWKILVDQAKCSFIHRQLSKAWATITDSIPEQLLNAAPIRFSAPAISSKRAREYQENESDNDSYGSLLSTGTNVSVMTTEDESFNNLPEEYKYPSYASAAANSTKTSNTQFSSPTVSEYTDWNPERQQMEQQIRDQAEQIKDQANQIEKIKADLQAKINRSQDLEDKLAQAIELAHSREARIEEMMLKFEQLIRIHTPENQDKAAPPPDDADEYQPTTPERLAATGPPPKKKPNNNASPNRNIYSIFRQQQSRQNSPKNSKPNPSPLRQPMETDEVIRQRSLGAKPSGNMSK
jgi:hypothetical protein